MMKLERIIAEIEKTKETISKQQGKLRELEAQKTEVENLQIVQMVRALRMTPAELSTFLQGKPDNAAATTATGNLLLPVLSCVSSPTVRSPCFPLP